MNAQTKIDTPTGLALLRQPFPAHQISKLPKETRAQIEARKADKNLMVWKCEVCGGPHHKNAVHLDYVGHAAATDRLLDADPNWSWEPLALAPDGLPAVDRNGGLWIRLTVCGVTRLGYGDADGKTGGNAVKEVIGDAIRNAGMRFGMALDLWHKGDLHLDEDAVEEVPPSEMPDAEWAKLAQLIKATGLPMAGLLKKYGVASLKHLNQDQYASAVEGMTNMLAEKAKAKTNTAQSANFGELIDDEIPY